MIETGRPGHTGGDRIGFRFKRLEQDVHVIHKGSINRESPFRLDRTGIKRAPAALPTARRAHRVR